MSETSFAKVTEAIIHLENLTSLFIDVGKMDFSAPSPAQLKKLDRVLLSSLKLGFKQ
ncbi:hypothetical protein K1F50_00500 [Muricauda oceani]|uniref:Uncharacterized protein n=1 Tax=Flagellimonas oceani TaxID=2698672 RepID=A0A6G7J299_9FLAO|nr:hypothetical protein [Allomuricauda oceani]MBW8241258.1 hypothetical protein [Allomuricauda oceani]QII44739.1 hypothetical protein GVT53_08610 [Allomuricauda oceani]